MTVLKAKSDGTPLIKHGERYKIQITQPDNHKADKNPAWAPYVCQNSKSLIFDGVFFKPEQKYEF